MVRLRIKQVETNISNIIDHCSQPHGAERAAVGEADQRPGIPDGCREAGERENTEYPQHPTHQRRSPVHPLIGSIAT